MGVEERSQPPAQQGSQAGPQTDRYDRFPHEQFCLFKSHYGTSVRTAPLRMCETAGCPVRAFRVIMAENSNPSASLDSRRRGWRADLCDHTSTRHVSRMSLRPLLVFALSYGAALLFAAD